MNEDLTKDIGDKYQTKPTLETVLERIDSLRTSLETRLGSVEAGMGEFETRVNTRLGQFETRVNVSLDRIEALANTTRGEMLGMRADFTELRGALKEHFPSVVK